MTTSLPPSDIFSLVHDSQEKSRILKDLIAYSASLKLKFLDPRSEVFQALPTSISGTRVFSKLLEPMPKPGPADQHVIVQFDLSEKKYICQTEFDIKADQIVLDFSGPLYHVQRRADFRLRIPTSFEAKMRLKKMGSAFDCQVVDLSAGGCRLEVPAGKTFAVGEIFKGKLLVSKREDLEIEVSIRHLDPSERGSVLAGAQFINQSVIAKNRIAALVMDLYREFFTKRS